MASITSVAAGREVQLDKAFLHRCCIQFSIPVSIGDPDALAVECRRVVSFVTSHARAHPHELVRALAWRVVDTPEEQYLDRAGSWALLQAVLLACGEAGSELSRTPLVDVLLAFLPPLIEHRWFTTVPREAELAGEGRGTAPSSSAGGASPGGVWGVVVSAGLRVVPAAMVSTSSLYSYVPSDAEQLKRLKQHYKSLAEGWRGVWREDIFHLLNNTVKRVLREGNQLTEKAEQCLSVPLRFQDSLWRLRRRNPRPGIAAHVLYVYGWTPQRDLHRPLHQLSEASRRAAFLAPESLSAVRESVDREAHPRVWAWMSRLVEAKGGCQLCDSWQHPQIQCPCEVIFQRQQQLASSSAASRSPHLLRSTMSPAEHAILSMSYVEAADILYQHGLRLPVRSEDVLDRVTKFIRDEKPYDTILTAYDCVRGAVTGPLERHALWIHASYSLLPSRTAFDRSGSDLSSAMRKAEEVFLAARRYREWDSLVESVEVLDTAFRRRTLPSSIQRALHTIKSRGSFFVCLLDGSLPHSYTPGKFARAPEEVVMVAGVKDVLCPCCLEPFHTMQHCRHHSEETKERWDLRIARKVVTQHRLLYLNLDGADPSSHPDVQSAMQRIQADDSQAKEFRCHELLLAVKLFHERGEAWCANCSVAGNHTTSLCPVAARATLRHERLELLDVRLNPTLLFHRVAELEQAWAEGRRSSAEADLHDLKEVYRHHVAPALYPSSYAAAVKELTAASIPLAAARYSTNAVQGFLLSINSSDLLVHLIPLRDAAFPEVCLYCDDIHHKSESCPAGKTPEEEVCFLTELRRQGISLWSFLQRQDYLSERLPTQYVEGKDGVLGLVRQFTEDYSPGGIARQRFLEFNNLALVSSGAMGAAGVVAIPSHQPDERESSTATTAAPHSYAREEEEEAGNVEPKTSAVGIPTTVKRITPYGEGGFSQLVRAPVPIPVDGDSFTRSAAAYAAVGQKRPRERPDAGMEDELEEL